MDATARRDELLRSVRSRGYLNVSEAALTLGVNSSTVRRDLAELHRLGLIERSHGGAIPVRDEAEVPYDVKLGKHIPEKRAIGRHIASTISEGATITLDSGSTSLMLAQALIRHSGITVITPDVRVAGQFVGRPDVRLIVLGGEILAGTATLLSQETIETLHRYHVDLAVIAVDAVDPEGASNMNGAVVPLKRTMIANAREAILAVDASKFGMRKLVKVAPLRDFSEIVSDDGVEESILDTYPVRVIRAKVNTELEGQP